MTEFKSENSNYKRVFVVIVVLSVILAGSFLRFYNLGKLDLWVDETYHLYSAKSLMENGEPTLPSGMKYSRAPVYTRLVITSFKIFGIDEFSVRFPSALFGVLNILVIFLIGRSILGTRIAMIAAFFLAFSYYSIAWSRISRFYTLMQFAYMLSVFFFYKSYEMKDNSKPRVNGVHYFKDLNINYFWLIVSGLFFILSYSTQLISAMLFPAILTYIFIMLLLYCYSNHLVAALKSKYFISFVFFIALFVFGVLFFDLGGLIKWAFNYRPDWANTAAFRNKYFYYNYFTSSLIFPLSVFFMMGTYYVFTRFHKGAFYIFINFFIPIAIASLFFSYKLKNYVYHIYPFYLLIGAFGIVNFYDHEIENIKQYISKLNTPFKSSLPRISKVFLVLLLCGWIPVTIWFKVGVKMPWLKPGEYNQVYSHRSWKWAADYVNENRNAQDVVISTVPLTLMFYNLESDYNLNNGYNDSATKLEYFNNDGKLFDVYSGKPSIANLTELKQIINMNPSGWLVLDTYRFSLRTCVPQDVADFIKNELKMENKDKFNTIFIYKWSSSD